LVVRYLLVGLISIAKSFVIDPFSTVAIGGFSTHDGSIGYFNSLSIEVIAMFFMFLAGINFSLHFVAWNNRSLMN